MPKVLFVTLHRIDRSPGQRFRFEQYLSFLESHGFEWEISNLLSEKDDKRYYQSGNYHWKAWIALKGVIKRFWDVLKANQYDIIFLYREAYFTGTTFFEKRFKASSAKLIFDFDDAIWMRDVSAGNKHLAFLKDPDKVPKLIALCDRIFVGNDYLLQYAMQFNPSCSLIPTTIDTVNLHNKRKKHEEKSRITIGWTGSRTTLKYLKPIYPILERLKLQYQIEVLVICDVPPEDTPFPFTYLPWNLESEIEDLLKIDIGVMPLPDDKWAKGKCGFKILQYMGLGIPAIASPVGVNQEIIEEGENGFLANSLAEWELRLTELIEGLELRKMLGKKGYETVEARYSVNSLQDRYLEEFQRLLGQQTPVVNP